MVAPSKQSPAYRHTLVCAVAFVCFFAGLSHLGVSRAQTLPQRGASATSTSPTHAEPDQKAIVVQLASNSLAQVENRYGSGHTNTLEALEALGAAHEKAADYKSAHSVLLKAYTIREDQLGRENIHTAKAAHVLGLVYLQLSEWSAAKKCFETAAEVRERLLGTDHLETARSINNIGFVHERLHEYSKAALFYSRSLASTQLTYGAGHSNTIVFISNLARTYNLMADYPKAKAMYEQYLEIRVVQIGSANSEVAYIKRVLGVIYGIEHSYEKALAHLQDSLQISLTLAGKKQVAVVETLLELSKLHLLMGDYARATSLMQESLSTSEALAGKSELRTAEVLEAMGTLFSVLGDFDRSNAAFQKCLQLRESELGKEHFAVLRTLLAIGFIHHSNNYLDKASVYYDRAWKMQIRLAGAEDPTTAALLIVIADIDRRKGDFDAATTKLKAALLVAERRYGEKHPLCIPALSTLGKLYLSKQEYGQAEAVLRRAVWLHENSGGGLTEPIAWYWALSCWNLGNMANCKEAVSKAQDDDQRRLMNVLQYAPEAQRLIYHKNREPYALVALTGSSKEWANVVIRNKGIVLDSILDDQAGAMAGEKSRGDEKMQEYRSLTLRIDLLKRATGTNQSAGAPAPELLKMEEQASTLLDAIEAHNPKAAVVPRALRIHYSEVQAGIPPKGVLLEFVRYRQYIKQLEFEDRYGVVVLAGRTNVLKGQPLGDPLWLPLGSAELIDGNLRKYVLAMRNGQSGDESVLRMLYTQLFRPVAKWIPADTSTLLVSPDSWLNCLNLGTLMLDDERFLSEKYSILYLASGRDLLAKVQPAVQEKCLVSFGNPSYRNQAGIVSKLTNAPVPPMLTLDWRDYVGYPLAQLPGAEAEAQFLKASASRWKLPVKSYLGLAATEAEIHALHSPYVLHLATHGMFLPLPTTVRPKLDESIPSMTGHLPLNNPMQRCALALVGAQTTLEAWNRGEFPASSNDGILTAQEVGALDLNGTWLVVLSACDTGLGELRNGEGVLGLRRGFVQAGAQNLLMTLWPISDKWSVDIMKAFYEKAMVSGDAPQAMAEVQAEWLGRLRKVKGVLIAARIAGPFVLSARGRQSTK